MAMDPHGVIGVNGAMPWHYPADFKRFKALTVGTTVIMGRATWESLPKPLPDRRCFVLSHQSDPPTKHPAGHCSYFKSLGKALLMAGTYEGDVWIAGGAQVYAEMLQHPLLDFCDVTRVPEVVQPQGEVTRFPLDILTRDFKRETLREINLFDDRLVHCRYERA